METSIQLIDLNAYPINLLIINILEQYTNIKLNQIINNHISYEI